MTTKVVNFDSLSERRIGPPPLTAAVISWNGLTGNVKGTLAEIWTFGAGDDAMADNLFAMPSGNLRFAGSRFSGFMPGMGYFESPTTPGDLRVGAYLAQRYFPGGGVGGTTGDEFVGFRPTWDGTFRGIDGLQMISEKVAFGHGTAPETGPAAELLIAEQTWWQISGFFDGPDYWPLLGFNSGDREDLLISLYNGEDEAMTPRLQMTGWGTYLGFPRVNTHGTTAAFDTQVDVSTHLALAAGDGIGWFIRRHADDPPKGVLRWFTVDGDFVAGNSGWQFFGSDGAGTLKQLLSLDPVNGAVFGVPVTLPTASGQPLVAYSIDLNMMTPGSGGFPIPARVGQAFTITRYSNMVVSVAGVCTGAPTFDVGAVGPTFNEIFANATQLTAVQINLGVGQMVSNNVTGYHMTSSAAVKTVCHTAATGTTQLTIRITYYGFWTAL